MRKKVGIIKRLFCLLLIFLLSINSFAAIVSDNDGSAFITKAEFDALKSSFQAQIDSYNQSIDSKIDGAIAAYLSGIRITKETVLDNYIEKLNNNSKLSYKYWTDTLNIGTGSHAKYGYYGGFWTANYMENTSTGGSFWGRLAAGGQANQPSFEWYLPTDYVREKVYLIDNFQGSKYLTGAAKQYHVRRGFVMAGGATTATLNSSFILSDDYMSKTSNHDSTKTMLELRFYEDVANVEDWEPGCVIDSWKTIVFRTPRWSIWDTIRDEEITSQILYGGVNIHDSGSPNMSLCVFNLTDEVDMVINPHPNIPPFEDEHVPMFLNPAVYETVCLDISDIEKAKVQVGNEFSVACSGRSYGGYHYENSMGQHIVERYANKSANYYNTIKYKFPQHLTQDINVSDLIDYDATLARGVATKGTEGALVCINNTNQKGMINLKLKFISKKGISENVKFALRDAPFTTATQLTSNVNTTYSTWTVATNTEIPITINNVEKNMELWIQLSPVTGGNFIGVEIVGDIKFTAED